MTEYGKWVHRKKSHCSIDDMIDQSKKYYVKMPKRGDTIYVSDRMQTGYKYKLSESPAKNVKDVWSKFKDSKGNYVMFRPKYLPAQMLEKGVFGGKMINDCMGEYPTRWYKGALKARRLSPEKKDVRVNQYGVDSGSSLADWKKSKWIRGSDPRGWFQWYCRYCMGRRHSIDRWQMQRWANIQRFYLRYKRSGGTNVTKQLLLQWSWPLPEGGRR